LSPDFWWVLYNRLFLVIIIKTVNTLLFFLEKILYTSIFVPFLTFCGFYNSWCSVTGGDKSHIPDLWVLWTAEGKWGHNYYLHVGKTHFIFIHMGEEFVPPYMRYTLTHTRYHLVQSKCHRLWFSTKSCSCNSTKTYINSLILILKLNLTSLRNIYIKMCVVLKEVKFNLRMRIMLFTSVFVE